MKRGATSANENADLLAHGLMDEEIVGFLLCSGDVSKPLLDVFDVHLDASSDQFNK